MKWTRRKLYGLNALAVLCLLFPSPDSRASEGALRADSHEIIEQNTDRVTGKIMAADGEPLAGASVMIRGTKIGTTADADGNYSIKAPEEGESYVLVFQYLGMRTKEIAVSTQRKLDVRLEEDNQLEAPSLSAHTERNKAGKT